MPTGVLTEAARTKWANALGNIAPYVFQIAFTYKFGEGGWVNPGSGKVPRVATPEQTDLDVILNPSRYPPPNDSSFANSFAVGDYTFIAPNSIQLRCRLNAGQYDFNGWGVQPQMWELGIYDIGGVMIAYCTFPMQQKTLGMALEDYVTITF